MGIHDRLLLLCVLPSFHHNHSYPSPMHHNRLRHECYVCLFVHCAVTIRHDVLQEGAEVDAKTTTGVTALWLAAGEGRKAVAADLIAKGSDVNNRRTDGITAVMAAAVGGHKV